MTACFIFYCTKMKMASFQISRTGFYPTMAARLGRRFMTPARGVRCRIDESDRSSNGEEQPESLFMKELKRRGMTPTSILEEKKRGTYEIGEKEMMEEERGDKKKRNGVAAAEFDKGVVDQRERSMALNSEGLEGLIPRGKLLLTLGGTFFLAFWPLILITVALTASLYLYFGSSFIHDASKMSIAPPPYIDPYTLLEDERITQISRSNQN